MITKEKYDEISGQWKEPIYQIWKRISHRLLFFCKFVDHFKDKDVLELGCNAGLYGMEIAKVAKSYLGIDREAAYVEQALITKKYIDNPNSNFINIKMKAFIRGELEKPEVERFTFNAFFASFVMYHLKDSEVKMVREYILPKCDTVVVQTRTQYRNPARTHNSYLFNLPKNIVKYLEPEGFKCTVEWVKDKSYAEIIAIRTPARSENVVKGNDEGDTTATSSPAE